MSTSEKQAEVRKGKVVQLSFLLKNSAGEVLDRADTNEPFSYLHGAHQIIPGLEAALEGLKKGQKKQIVVEPEEGYGMPDPRLRMKVERSQFPKGTDLQVGMQFHAQPEEQGEPGHGPSGLVFVVEQLDGEMVHVNGNHPLAGQTLHYDLEVLDIREATAEELEHGHAH